jgi:hypothetical protein
MERSGNMRGAVAAGVVAGSLVLTAAPAAATCARGWGSTPEISDHLVSATVVTARAGRQACFERFVVEVSGPRPGYRASYVPAVHVDPSDAPVPLRGGAAILFVVDAPSYSSVNGHATYRPADLANVVNVSGYQTLKQVAWAGTFEGLTSFGIGVRSRLPFRVFTLSGPGSHSRVVIDVARSW